MNISTNEFKVNSPEERLKLISAALNTPMPATILGAHGEPTDQLLDFCIKTGASLDWIFVDIEPARHDDKIANTKNDLSENHMNELHDLLALALDITEGRKPSYQSLQEARSYTRRALRILSGVAS